MDGQIQEFLTKYFFQVAISLECTDAILFPSFHMQTMWIYIVSKNAGQLHLPLILTIPSNADKIINTLYFLLNVYQSVCGKRVLFMHLKPHEHHSTCKNSHPICTLG